MFDSSTNELFVLKCLCHHYCFTVRIRLPGSSIYGGVYVQAGIASYGRNGCSVDGGDWKAVVNAHCRAISSRFGLDDSEFVGTAKQMYHICMTASSFVSVLRTKWSQVPSYQQFILSGIDTAKPLPDVLHSSILLPKVASLNQLPPNLATLHIARQTSNDAGFWSAVTAAIRYARLRLWRHPNPLHS